MISHRLAVANDTMCVSLARRGAKLDEFDDFGVAVGACMPVPDFDVELVPVFVWIPGCDPAEVEYVDGDSEDLELAREA